MLSSPPFSATFPIALGTAGFGSDVSPNDSYRLLDTYRAAGGNHLDTAFDYASWIPNGLGASERTIGEWLRSSGARKQTIIATKAGCTRGDVKRLKREILREELSLSLDRLGVSQVDIFWLHRDDPSIAVDEILGWIEELRAEGKFVVCGASNWSSARLDEAKAYADRRNLLGFFGSQCGWNLALLDANPFSGGDTRFLQPEDERWHERTGFPLVPFESQAGGFFAGRYEPGTKPTTPRGHVVTLHYANDANWRRLAIARELAAKHRATPNQIILAWLRHQKFPVIPIVGPHTIEQLNDSLGSIHIQLTPDEVRRLRNPD